MYVSTRPNLSAEVAESVRTMITSGRLPPGERINEVHLARELDVSRTPLREALARLESEGFLIVRPRYGFFVRRLTAADLYELYEVRAVLDPGALGAAGLPSREQIARLRELNRAIAGAKGARRVIELDDAFHLALIEHGRNRLMMSLIRQHMERTRATEYAYMSDPANVRRATAEHERILEALEAGDLSRAVAALEANMRTALSSLADSLEDSQ